ncbi:MAG: PilZ domain-containing protein [Deltaproteobacteria bacterium]|nr:PilZ domain-containing protein [Deltaproteobacteria bacterium]
MRKEPVEDRRKEYRHKICVDAQAITPKSSFEVLATNISGGGLEIQCPSIINPRTELMITLQLQEEFVFHGTVIWTLGDFVDNRWLYRVGIKTNAISFKTPFLSKICRSHRLKKRRNWYREFFPR